MAKRKIKAFRLDMELPTPAQLANGDFERDFTNHVETNTKAMTYRNRGGTPLCRWVAGKKLDDVQLRVINRCLEIWRLIGMHQSLTAKYGERLDRSSDWSRSSVRALEAKEDLARFKSYFPGRARDYFSVFENVIRHNIPAGVAGAVDTPDKKVAANRALTIVRFVCDIIATHEKF